MWGGAFSSGAGRGGDKNPRGGVGQGEKTRKTTDPKFDKSAQIVTGGLVSQCGALIKEKISFSDF